LNDVAENKRGEMVIKKLLPEEEMVRAFLYPAPLFRGRRDWVGFLK
jgi:hypothetical protein